MESLNFQRDLVVLFGNSFNGKTLNNMGMTHNVARNPGEFTTYFITTIRITVDEFLVYDSGIPEPLPTVDLSASPAKKKMKSSKKHDAKGSSKKSITSRSRRSFGDTKGLRLLEAVRTCTPLCTSAIIPEEFGTSVYVGTEIVVSNIAFNSSTHPSTIP